MSLIEGQKIGMLNFDGRCAELPAYGIDKDGRWIHLLHQVDRQMPVVIDDLDDALVATRRIFH